MSYSICSFDGDYPLDNQPYWGYKLNKLDDAISLARAQHSKLAERDGDGIYTVILIEEEEDDTIYWISYKGTEISNKLEATKLADSLASP
jgi:hypothetical protein